MNTPKDLSPAARITPSYRPTQVEKQPPCQEACPNCGDIRGWIGTIAQREKTGMSLQEAYRQAWSMITDVNPFPSVLGRVCPHPCEQHCNRSEHDESLAINAMERFLGDWAIEQRVPLNRLDGDARQESIGVVGAGPSGLSFAYQMARRGYSVTVYESREKAGGMLRYGVPDYRLPQAVLDAEIGRIIDLGIDLRLNTRVGRDISFEDLRERHQALYLGLGAQQGRGLGLPGEDGPSVWTGTDYLARVNCGEEVDLGRSVVVIGGGNSAVDAARTARRTGAEVTILYRRTRAEMPAIPAEIDDALEEGIDLQYLAAPVRIDRSENGELEGLTAVRMALGEADESGRRRPVPVPDSEFKVPADTVIAAIAQSPVLDGFEALDRDGSWLVTDEQGQVGDEVLAGGDALGLGIAGNAIVQGRNAAEHLHARLSGQRTGALAEHQRASIGPERVDFESKSASEAARAERLEGAERIASGNAEVTATVTEDQFLKEVDRCYSCGSCMGCEQCFMFCTAGCFTRVEEAAPGFYFSLSLDACEECGKCIEVCPCGFLEVS
jgi:NADPH-dependent glutamate synthase beta subunit-like oxidoreductase/Pyruvate/2-oxoacid:ferredoxin oxidoreductase delta subunit